MCRLVQGDQRSSSFTRRGDPMDGGVVRIEEAIASEAQSEHLGEIAVDDSSMADHGNLFATMTLHKFIDTRANPEMKLGWILVALPGSSDQRLPSRIIARLQLLHRDVLGRMSIPFRNPVDFNGFAPKCCCHRSRRLHGSAQRARIDGIEVLGGEVGGEMLCLECADFGQFGVGGPRGPFPANGEGVPDQQQVHISTR